MLLISVHGAFLRHVAIEQIEDVCLPLLSLHVLLQELGVVMLVLMLALALSTRRNECLLGVLVSWQ